MSEPSPQDRPPPPLLEVTGLRTHIQLKRSTVHAVDGVDLTVRAGETLGLVGESGCGKTMTALSLIRLLPAGGRVVDGAIRLDGQDLLTLDDDGMRQVRGARIGMIFQDPLTSLNPSMTIGAQIAEAVRLHRHVSHTAARRRAVDVLDLVGIARAASRLDDYPHQFSGGMRQRVMIAIALACDPQLLIADEPTTALDVTIQAQILELIDRLRRDLGMGVILVTHDLGVIAGRADRVAVMYAGRVVEQARADRLFAGPRHRYTEALLRALPERAASTRERLYTIPGLPPDLTQDQTGCRFAPRCQFAQDDCRQLDPPLLPAGSAPVGHQHACLHPVDASRHIDPGQRAETSGALGQNPEVLLSVQHLVKSFPVRHHLFGRVAGTVSAVADVTFEVCRGHTLGLVGESGCGKTTLGRLVVGLDEPTAGTVRVDGRDLGARAGRGRNSLRRAVQFMFQDSFASLDPRMRVGAILMEPLAIQRVGTRGERQDRVAELLDLVGLPRSSVERYPHEFSGGQRQRIALARALSLSPRLVVADEPVSALDVSIQAQVLNSMRDLQAELDLTYIVISHDLAVVRYLADRIGVMYLGKLVEEGPARQVYEHPLHPYTHALIASVPDVAPRPRRGQRAPVLGGALPSAIDPPSGCRFRTRCPRAQQVCADQEPALHTLVAGDHRVACHFPLHDVPTGGAPTSPTSSTARPA